jgi:hypothetical protein
MTMFETTVADALEAAAHLRKEAASNEALADGSVARYDPPEYTEACLRLSETAEQRRRWARAIETLACRAV